MKMPNARLFFGVKRQITGAFVVFFGAARDRALLALADDRLGVALLPLLRELLARLGSGGRRRRERFDLGLPFVTDAPEADRQRLPTDDHLVKLVGTSVALGQLEIG